MDELLKGFPVIIELEVRWGDMDAFQHVNNTVYFRYFESGRIAYFENLGLFEKSRGIGPILASTQCRFRFPLTYPDRVSVGTRVTEIKEDRLLMTHWVVSHRHQKIAAKGESVTVCYHYREQKKTAFPAQIKARVWELEGGKAA
ncbi:MAG: acyl-CoA thioesterase [Ardenticatenaceae bacterium]